MTPLEELHLGLSSLQEQEHPELGVVYPPLSECTVSLKEVLDMATAAIAAEKQRKEYEVCKNCKHLRSIKNKNNLADIRDFYCNKYPMKIHIIDDYYMEKENTICWNVEAEGCKNGWEPREEAAGG